MTTRFIGHLLTGTHAARPAASAVPEGTLYSCTTHNLVYQSDTSSWAQWLDAGAATIAAGSNSTRVRELSTAGTSTTLWSPFDHAHDGIGTITASSSNTLQRGTVNLRPGNNVSFGLTDTDGDGEFDTLTINGAAAGAAGSVATDAIYDAKGDLPVGTGANTAARLPVGANGTVLTADSAEATGLKWAAGGGGGLDTPVRVQSVVGQGSAQNPALTIATPANGALLVLGLNLTNRESSGVASTNTTWTLMRRYTSGAIRCEIYAGVVSTGGGTTITVTTGANDFYAAAVIEVTNPGVTPTLGSYVERATFSGGADIESVDGWTPGTIYAAVMAPGNSSQTGYTWSSHGAVAAAAPNGCGLLVGFVPPGGSFDCYANGHSGSGGVFLACEID